MADDIAAIASAIELERVRVVGHSMGGINAYLCAARHPALIDALVVVDVGPDSLTSAWAMANLAPLLRAWAEASFSDPDEAVATYLAGETGPHDEELRRFVLHNLRQRPDGRWTWRFDTAGLQSFLTNAPDPDAQWAALRQVACPALVVRGALSEVLSAPTAARMRQELPRGRLVEIADAGHDVHIEQRAALLAEAGAFLAAG
jgi:pimeloyl-ACP methyl ester carboxylesterase